MWRKLLLAVLAVALVGCQAPCGKGDCLRPSLVVDDHGLPYEWLRDGQLTICADAKCVTQPASSDSHLGTAAAPLAKFGVAPRKISFSVRIGSRTVLNARSSERFKVWTKESRCPDCRRGSAFVAIDRHGHFSQ